MDCFALHGDIQYVPADSWFFTVRWNRGRNKQRIYVFSVLFDRGPAGRGHAGYKYAKV